MSKEVMFMRILLKIIAIPFVVALTIIGAVFTFIHFLSAWVFYVISFILGIGGIVILFSGDTYIGIGNLVIAFLIFILPTIAERIADKLDDLNFSLKNFIAS